MAKKTKRVKGDELSPTLPNDVMVEILSRLSVVSIVRFKRVSTFWLTMLADSHFVKLHLTRSKNSKLVLTHSFNVVGYPPHPMWSLYVSSCGGMVEDGESTRVDIYDHVDGIDIFNDDHIDDNDGYGYRYYGYGYYDDDGDGDDYDDEQKNGMTIAGSCHGLVLCYFTYYRTLYLVNLSTREMFKLPDSPFKNFANTTSFGLGYDASRDDYKVVQVSLYEKKKFIRMSLYSLKSNCWGRISDFPFSSVFDSAVFLNGKFHWFDEDGSKIASLSLDEEKFGDVPLPPGLTEIPELVGIVKGYLYLLLQSSSDDLITFWVMKEYGRRESWTKYEFVLPSSTIS
ncbi:F-box/kelch-repeat protein At3g06240-like [Cornus florida]|uniref:F-box/kelch-repeat protein At3g06240-like n=1 Tax=Cornus florida TaxID=4283 RepID=UPI002898E89E|nr:F-box/kelch-repeat protein At3g06240-like [Cornus florida]